MLERRPWTFSIRGAPAPSWWFSASVLWLPGFFSLPPTDRDESRFAQASKQMIETGDYVRIMNGEEPRNRKPIGIYWLQGACRGSRTRARSGP